MKNNKKYGYEKTQEQIDLVAHDKILVFENFRYLLEVLEEYIEKTGCFPNFNRQFRNITIPKEKKYSVNNCENLFRTKLLIFLGVLSDDTPDDTRKEVKEEFWKWIDVVGIDANNCPDEKLRYFLIEVNKVIEGSSEKIFEQTKERLDNKYKNNLPSWESVMNVFGSIQKPLDDKRDQADLYKDKNYFEVENENKVRGNSSQGEQIFNQLTGTVSSDSFNFYSKQSSSSPAGSSNTTQPNNPQQQEPHLTINGDAIIDGERYEEDPSIKLDENQVNITRQQNNYHPEIWVPVGGGLFALITVSAYWVFKRKKR